MSLRNEGLREYFLTNFSLMQYHKYSLTELESMIPWERETYVAMVRKHVKEENERIQKENERIAATKRKRK